MNAPFQPGKSGSGFSLAVMAWVLSISMLIPFFGGAQIPKCVLVDIKTGKEIDFKNGFKTSEIPDMKVVVVGGKGDYRVDVVEATWARGTNTMSAIQSVRNPGVIQPWYFDRSLLKAGDRWIVKVLKIVQKNAAGVEQEVAVNNMQFVIQIH